MINKVVLFLMTLSLPYSAFAKVGGSEGTGGGKGVLCQSSDNKITIESLDRYEAIHLFRYNVSPSQDFEAELNRMVDKLVSGADINFGIPPSECPFCIQHPRSREEGRKSALAVLADLRARFAFLPAGQRLSPVSDVGQSIPVPENCSLVQIISFSDGGRGGLDGTIQVDREYWNLLTEQDHVSLLLHEFIYRALRNNYAEPNSGRVRRIVGLLLSNEIYPDQNLPLKDAQELVRCGVKGTAARGDGFAFYVIPAASGSTIVFDTIMDQAPILAMTGHSSASYQSWKDVTARNMEIVSVASILDRYDVLLSLETSGWTIQYVNGPAKGHMLSVQCETWKRL